MKKKNFRKAILMFLKTQMIHGGYDEIIAAAEGKDVDIEKRLSGMENNLRSINARILDLWADYKNRIREKNSPSPSGNNSADVSEIARCTANQRAVHVHESDVNRSLGSAQADSSEHRCLTVEKSNLNGTLSANVQASRQESSYSGTNPRQGQVPTASE